MKKTYLKNSTVTICILCIAFSISLILQNVFVVNEGINAIFIFAVFLISLLTESYIYGIVGAILGTLAVNYAFTFPFFAINFTIPENLISAIIMIIIAVLTSALTTKLKLHEALKAESERERMRANLLRAVSHDLRTPLTTIYGFSATILDHKDSLLDEQKNKMVESIKEDAEWLIRMVENLLSITRIDSGKVKINKFPTVLEELIDSVMIKFQKRYPTQEVSIDIPNDIPNDIVVIPMDAILIEQVLVNILENAVQHAKGMTDLMLKVSVHTKQAIFEITDNGCGIDEDYLESILKGRNDMREATGNGLNRNAGIGLSVCATIIKAHGGEIKAENAKTGGAIFKFTLDTEDSRNE